MSPRVPPPGVRTWWGHHNKFLSRAAHEEHRAAEHRVKVRFDGVGYRAVCSCSWTAPEHRTTRAEAEQDGAEHR